MENYTQKEIMTIAASRFIKNSDIVFCGTGISMLAAMAAKHINAKKSTIIFETGAIGASIIDLPMAVGDPRVMYNAEIFGTLADSFSFMQNKFTGKNITGILGAAQIDQYGNLNSTVIGDYFNPNVRFAGSGGGADVASFADRIIIFIKHEKRKFVKKLDYLTSPGWIDGYDSRKKKGLTSGGPYVVITDMGIIGFDKKSKKMYLKGYYPNIDPKLITDNMSFELDISKAVKIKPPSKKELFVLRNKCDPHRLILQKRHSHNFVFCPISALKKIFNPRNTYSIPAVKNFFRLKLEQNPLWCNDLWKEFMELNFSNNKFAQILFGEDNKNLKKISEHLNIVLNARGNKVLCLGDEISLSLAKNILEQLYDIIKEGYPVYLSDVEYAVEIICADHKVKLKDIFLNTIYITAKRQIITPKNISQKRYIDAIRNFDIVFGIGPAGTGKTYLAMATAVSELMKKQVSRIILTRPAVEAGEALGFLPGDLAEKIDPYLRPLYDALYDMMSFEKAGDLMENNVIEVAPLAFMRGRTLNDAFIILDEAQNATSEQMKMFLTRIGLNSKAVVTGDITQIDLPHDRKSGLIEAKNILKKIEGINFVFFSDKDVVRHKLVRKIIKAYEIAGQTDGYAQKNGVNYDN